MGLAENLNRKSYIRDKPRLKTQENIKMNLQCKLRGDGHDGSGFIKVQYGGFC